MCKRLWHCPIGLEYSILFTLFFSLCFSLSDFYWSIFSHCFFLQLCWIYWWASRMHSSSITMLFISSTIFDSSVYSSLMKFSIYSCILFTFSTEVFNILIRVILTSLSLSDSSNIWVTSEFGSLHYFVSWYFIVFSFSVCFIIFVWKLGILFRTVDTDKYYLPGNGHTLFLQHSKGLT